MPQEHNQRESTRKMPGTGLGIIFMFMGISWLVHVLSLVSLPDYKELLKEKAAQKAADKRTPVKISIVEKKTVSEKIEEKDDLKVPKNKKIIEAIQKPTEKAPEPDKARLGYTTHRTEKETKTERRNSESGKDPAVVSKKVPAKGKPAGKPRNSPEKDKARKSKAKLAKKNDPWKTGNPLKPSFEILSDLNSPVKIKRHKPRNNYEKILNNSMAMLGSEVNAGYQDYIDEEIEVGDTLDLNTQEYRYIGYFTNLRKAIELAVVYPSYAARRGMSGRVFFKFTINKDGQASTVQVLDSSGHKILDQALVEAIRIAAPFAPLPQDFGKKLNIQGTFRFILQ